MLSILYAVHVVLALAILGLIMIQQGKGAEMGASFGGGASQTLFGSGGSGNFFSRLTAIAVALFFASSVILAVQAKNSSALYETDELLTPEVETVPDLGGTSESAVPAVDPNALPDLDAPNAQLQETIRSAEEAVGNAATEASNTIESAAGEASDAASEIETLQN